MPHSYPEILLPKQNYRIIDNGDIESEKLIRYVDRQNEDDLIVDENNQVLAEYICNPSDKIEDLSMSLLGHYKVEDVKLAFVGDHKFHYSEDWRPPNESTQPISNEKFFIDEKRSFWHIDFVHLDNIQVTVSKLVGKELTKVPAVSSIVHKPTKGNFWHYTLNWCIEGINLYDDSFSSNQKKRMASKIAASARAIIIQHAKIQSIKPEGVKEVVYVQN